MQARKQKVGRNALCPCGSGKKFKKCHGGIASRKDNTIDPETLEFIKHKLEVDKVLNHQRKCQQGLGRPIISTELNGQRFVAVGKKLMMSSTWKTFHDFLINYLADVLTPEWGNAELAKPLENRHPIVQWYTTLCEYQQATIMQPGQVVSAKTNGAVAAFLNLAYSLYLLEHNAEIHGTLLRRVKNQDHFHGAYYEIFVASSFIHAGFEIEFENEEDTSTTHYEFTATHAASGKKYSVEAKARHVAGVLGVKPTAGVKRPDRVDLTRNFRSALKKQAKHTRVIFIDVNVPDKTTGKNEFDWLMSSIKKLQRNEYTKKIDGVPAPEAYIFATNFPYHYEPDSFDFRVAVFLDGFKIPDFRPGSRTLRDALQSRDKHSDMLQLWEDIKNRHVPVTFDGEIPEYAFGQIQEARLKIGEWYLIPDQDGREIGGVLVDATVAENDKRIWAVYKLEDGQQVIVYHPMSEVEFAVYKRHPDTFFGDIRRVSREARDPLELYDFFYETYKESPREKLLEFMNNASGLGDLSSFSQSELAKIYCEGLVCQVMLKNSRKQA
jgi:hypothetical protein